MDSGPDHRTVVKGYQPGCHKTGGRDDCSSLTNTSPPQQIYIIRHVVKSADPPTPTAAPSRPFGVTTPG